MAVASSAYIAPLVAADVVAAGVADGHFAALHRSRSAPAFRRVRDSRPPGPGPQGSPAVGGGLCARVAARRRAQVHRAHGQAVARRECPSLAAFYWKEPVALWPVRQRVAGVLCPDMGPGLWIVDETGFPKQGTHSVGVARQYSGTLGKVANCQVAVSLHHATATASLPVDWALFLPEEWTQDPDRCAAAGVPGPVHHQPKWRLALDLIDHARTWGLADQRVIADAGYGTIAEFRAGLRARRLPYAVGVESGTGVWTRRPRRRRRPNTGRGRPPTRWDYGGQRPPQCGRRGPRAAGRRVPHRDVARREQRDTHGRASPGSECGPPTGTTRASRRRTSNGCSLNGRRTPPNRRSTGSPPPHSASRWLQLVRWAKARWRVEQDYAQLKDDLGLDHFEGRRWLGWHHHVTMTTMAYGFLIREQLRHRVGRGKKRRASPRSPRSARNSSTS